MVKDKRLESMGNWKEGWERLTNLERSRMEDNIEEEGYREHSILN